MADGVDWNSLPRTLVRSRGKDIAGTERFSLLLLEFGEIYFEDFSSVYVSSVESVARRRGRLKVCSHSILFDPLSVSDPVIKIAYRDCVKISLRQSQDTSLAAGDGNSLVLEAGQVTEMLERNILAPYKFNKGVVKHVFSFDYGNTEAVYSQIMTLFKASKLPRKQQESVISRLVSGRRNAVSFNTSWLENLYEERIFQTSGERVTPLVSNPGRIMLTASGLYFQPYNNVEVEPVLKLALSELQLVLKRRYLLRHVGIEMFFGKSQSMFLALASRQERDQLYTAILKLVPGAGQHEGTLTEVTHKWQTGQLSNYEYLMILNFLADRSFNDIMQYPVMPWIIADYTSPQLDLTSPSTFRDLSRPIGALNKERLEFFKDRYSEMSGVKFLYGTHYSAPGYVLYYLVRAAPEYLLCLQAGNFDRPNRLFHSIARTWDNVNSDHADVKELIPEFYQTPGTFLTNTMNLDLGVRTDEASVNDVVLPPWAKDASHFTAQCREALESDYVSQHLHLWIDLIFGYKQRGHPAEQADNLFHYLTYEGAIDLDSIHDPEEKAAIILQIKEFGQTPRQLLAFPHPSRLNKRGTELVEEEVRTVGCTTEGLSRMDSSSSNSWGAGPSSNSWEPTSLTRRDTEDDDWVNVSYSSADGKEEVKDEGDQSPNSTEYKYSLTLRHRWKPHKEAVSGVQLAGDGKTLFSVSHDKTLKAHLLKDRNLVRSSQISSLPLSCLRVLPDSKTVLVGSWDNNVYAYSVEFASVLFSAYCHDSSVTSLCWKQDILATGSWDSTVKVWHLESASKASLREPELQCELDHDNEVCCVDVNPSATLVASGTVDGFVTMWRIPDGTQEWEQQVHSDTVKTMAFSPDGMRLCTCGADKTVLLIDLTSRAQVISRTPAEPICSLLWCKDVLILGQDGGSILLWDSYSFKSLAEYKEHDNAVTALDVSNDGSTLVSGSKDRSIALWTLTRTTS